MLAPLVTIIVLNWNGRHLLEDCLPSVLQQTLQDYELIVVDNGSTDGSLEWVASHYPKTRLISLPTNMGFCEGNNVGIRSARGDYVVLLNNDTEVAPDWLEQLLAHICTDPSIAACDSKILYFDQRESIWSSGGTYSIAGTTTFRWHNQQDSGRLQQPSDVFVVGACSAIYRRRIFEEIGLLDRDFFAGFEDVDWSFRAHLRGYRTVNVPTSRVYHKVSMTHQRNSPAYVYHGQRNVWATFVKNMPSSLLFRYWPLHLLYALGSWVYFARIGRGRAFAQAKADAARQSASLWIKRREVQKMRTVSPMEIDALLDHDWLMPKLAKLRGQSPNPTRPLGR